MQNMAASEYVYQDLMAGQLGIWYAQLLIPDNSAYNIGDYLEIPGDLAIGLYERALRQMTGEVHAAHLRFLSEGDTPKQYLHITDDWPFRYLDVSSAADPYSVARNWMLEDMSRP